MSRSAKRDASIFDISAKVIGGLRRGLLHERGKFAFQNGSLESPDFGVTHQIVRQSGTEGPRIVRRRHAGIGDVQINRVDVTAVGRLIRTGPLPLSGKHHVKRVDPHRRGPFPSRGFGQLARVVKSPIPGRFFAVTHRVAPICQSAWRRDGSIEAENIRPARRSRDRKNLERPPARSGAARAGEAAN